MSLRIAWACHPGNIGLGIAANVFVYVGTIILFMIDWFFVQRIVRAQHQQVGWSIPYRIFHRGALAVLAITLIMLIMVNIWQFFTISSTKIHVFRALQLTGQTYFTVFCFAPAVLVLLSVLIPRHEVEKFGAGRLRVNITILLVAVAVLTTGQLFRCVIAWIPQTPLLNSVGQPVKQPWYLHKVCFYIFNFATEIVVVIMFAVVRVDLRFHVPNGSRMSGDYSGRNSRVNLDRDLDASTMASRISLAYPVPNIPMSQPNISSETLHQYEESVFEDSGTLADSLKYGGSTLEVDHKSGAWKVKRLSSDSYGSRCSYSSVNRSSINDRSVTFADDAPPVPNIPSEWPLPNTPPPNSSMSSLAYSNPPSRRGTPKRTFEIADRDLNGADVGDAITHTLAALEQNSARQQAQSPNELALRSRQISHTPRKRATYPPKSSLKGQRSHTSTTSMSSHTPTIVEAPELPPKPKAVPATPVRTPSTVEYISLSHLSNPDARRILDMSLQGDKASDISIPVSKDGTPQQSGTLTSIPGNLSPSSAYKEDTASSDAREYVAALGENRRFSYESGDAASGRPEP
jgi:hypothetical protein